MTRTKVDSFSLDNTVPVISRQLYLLACHLARMLTLHFSNHIIDKYHS